MTRISLIYEKVFLWFSKVYFSCLVKCISWIFKTISPGVLDQDLVGYEGLASVCVQQKDG